MRGYEVFRSVSAACSCDLAVLKDKRLLRVEVRTGVWNLRGELSCSFPDEDIGKQDVLAIVSRDMKTIVYKPEML